MIVSSFFINGCYTKFASYDSFSGIEENSMYDSTVQDDSLSDSIKSNSSKKYSARVDTIIKRDKEICIWERDFSGYPYLRCFPSNYSSDWYFYNNSPWWFRSSTYWYDYKRCPRYYYYNPDCGCCTYYGNHPYTHRPHHGRPNGGGNSEGGSNVGSSPSNRSRDMNGVVRQIPKNNQVLPKSTEPVKNGSSSPVFRQSERSTGSSGIVRPIEKKESAVPKKASSVPEPAPAIKADQPNKPFNADSSGHIQRSRPNRNSRW